MVSDYGSVQLNFITDESGLCDFATKHLMTNNINERQLNTEYKFEERFQL